MESIIENNKNVWLVNGTSSGLGLELVKKLLIQGNKVAAFTRKPEQLNENLKKSLGDNFDNNNLLIIKTDVSNDEDIKNATKTAVDHFGKIDVVVNNAGYGLFGAVEEISDSEFRDIFNVNVFGTLNVLRHTTPYLRKQKSGTIFNVSSQLGWDNFPNFSAYGATKHAINAISFSLQKELKPFGVDVVLLSPGGFRTEYATNGNLATPSNPVSDYNTNASVQFITEYSQSQNTKGDPTRFADLLIEISKLNEKPDNIFVGSDAVAIAKPLLENTLKNVDKWYKLSISTDYPSN